MYSLYTRQNMSNLSHYIRYTTQTYRDDNNLKGYGICINTCWDISNKELDYLLYKEFNFSLENTSKKFNLMWLEKAKEVFEWKKGNEMKLFTKMNREGFFDIFEVYNPKEFSNIIIDKMGFASVLVYNPYYTEKYNNNIKSEMYITLDSVYNDKINDELVI